MRKINAREKKEFIVMKPDSKEILNILFNLSALTRIEKDIGTWYEHGYLNADQGAMIRAEIKNLLGRLKKYIVVLTDTMLPANENIDCMLAPEDGDIYSNIQNKLYNSPGVFSRISVWEEIISGPKL